MKTALRTLIYLSLIVWLGAEIFFPVVAQVSFSQLAPNTHAAGLIVRQCLHILHNIGLVSGLVLLALFALAPNFRLYHSRSVLVPMALIVGMIGLTCYSQFSIIPTMEQDRIAAGGAIDLTPKDNPAHQDFDRLHHRSTTVEETVLLLGLFTVILLARSETTAVAARP